MVIIQTKKVCDTNSALSVSGYSYRRGRETNNTVFVQSARQGTISTLDGKVFYSIDTPFNKVVEIKRKLSIQSSLCYNPKGDLW